MSDRLEGDVWQFLDEHAAYLIRAYFAPNPTPFTGRAFDTLGGGGSRSGVANHFSTDDLVAVSMLGVNIPGEAAITLLDDPRWESLLLAVDNQQALWLVDVDLVSAESPASVLWNTLNHVPGIGWVTAHKLCARKRPLLLPVYDAVVKAALQPNRQSFWEPLHNEFADGELQSRLMKLRDEAAVPQLSLLRVLDVAIWMRNQGIQSLSTAQRREGLGPLPFQPHRSG